MQAFGLGLGFLFVSLYGGQLAGLESLLFGTFLGITAGQVLTLLWVAVAALALLAAIGRPLLFASVDGAVARAGGVPTRRSSPSPSCCCSGWRSRRPPRSPAPCSSSPCWSPRRRPRSRSPPGPAPAWRSRSRSPSLVTWVGLGIAYFSPYPVGFWVTSLSFGLYVAGAARGCGARRLAIAGRRAARRPRLMFAHEFMRNAFLAGTFVALACGAVGYFVVLRSQVFAGDALSHVAFTGALAAAAAGIDIRLGLFVATIARRAPGWGCSAIAPAPTTS